MSEKIAIAAMMALSAIGAAARKGSRSLRETPESYSTSSWLAVRGTVLEDHIEEPEMDEDGERIEPDPEERLYHVTTNATKVMLQGLKSREALKKQAGEDRSYGLGGGVRDMAPNLISATITLSAARRIKKALQTAILAAQDKIEPAEAIACCIEWTGFPNKHGWLAVQEEIQRDFEYNSDETGVYSWEEYCWNLWAAITGKSVEFAPSDWKREIYNNKDQINQYWSQYGKGCAYSAILETEQEIYKIWENGITWENENQYFSNFVPTIGFTESHLSMSRMNAEKVQILSIAAKGEAYEVFPPESEARFRPESVIVLGVVE